MDGFDFSEASGGCLCAGGYPWCLRKRLDGCTRAPPLLSHWLTLITSLKVVSPETAI